MVSEIWKTITTNKLSISLFINATGSFIQIKHLTPDLIEAGNFEPLQKRKTHKIRTSFFDLFQILAADLPYSQTAVTQISKKGHYYIHLDIRQNMSINVREDALFQPFPDDKEKGKV